MKFELSISDELIQRLLAGERPALILSEDFQLSSEPVKKVKRLARGAVNELSAYTDLLGTVTHKVQKAWLAQYELTKVILELEKASTWLENATKKPKSLGSFLNNWITRAIPKPVVEPQRVRTIYE